MDTTDTPPARANGRIGGFACTAATCGIDLADHLAWARSVARGVRKHYKFQARSQEEQELEAVAYLTLVQKFREFDPSQVPPGGDPAGQFRGWVHPSIRGDCQREARRLRNGGTYHTRRERDREPIAVCRLPVRHHNDGSEFIDLEAPGEKPEPVTNSRSAQLLGDLLDRLTPSERLAVELRHGLRPGGRRTTGEIADALCVALAEARAIEASAMAKLTAERPADTAGV